MNNQIRTKTSIIYPILFVLLYFALALPSMLCAEDSTCARVKIEVKQELTLERQAFDAHMKINNGLTHAPLENIKVDVWFTDEDGNPVEATSDSNDPDASFYIRIDEMVNIDNVSGSGEVPADSSSDIHWLIIPAPGASNGLEKGKLYNVGASLTYTIGGEENKIEVSPDYIFVKPMPDLTLDYFLPEQVYGDDPFTSLIEPGIPFTLGVRVKNSGSGIAQNLKIDSAQPKIIDNDQGLLINFTITGSEVNGVETPESLLVDFGTIDPDTSSNARWIMTCSLSGKFVDFDATFTHADELGGELTSLIKETNTHTLVRDVLVDLPGRDHIRDFLSRAEDIYTVYESDNTEFEVTDHSSVTSLAFKGNQGQQSHYPLTVPPAAGFIYSRVTDPHAGTKILNQVVRSDGKLIPSPNAWLSKVQDSETHEWTHYLNIFDADTTADYTVVFDPVTASPLPPVLQYIPDKADRETRQISFIIQASDPNGTIPALSAVPLPVGATLTDSGDGTGIFDWTPAAGQKGIYTVTFSASDGQLASDQQVRIEIFDAGDLDMDGMPDAWEQAHFQDLTRDGSGDYDHDGVSDLQEFTDQTDPTLDESAPTTPDPLYPHPNIPVTEETPQLVIENSSDTQNDTIDYAFEIYADEQMTQLVAGQDKVARAFGPRVTDIYNWLADTGGSQVPSSEATTSWQVPEELADNTRYYWRVRSADQEGSSLWAYYDFFVNRSNDPPAPFSVAGPSDNTGVASLTPELIVMNSSDLDFNPITYTFEIYEDDTLEIPVVSSGPVTQETGTTTSWTVTQELTDKTFYFWKVTADDGSGGTTATATHSFYVDTENRIPASPSILSPAVSTEIETRDTLLTVANAVDADGDPLTYTFEVDISDTFDSPEKQKADLIPESFETTSWQVFGLKENTGYFWRAKANDGSAESPWVTGRFFVNQINDPPSTPTVKNPGNNAWVDTRTPVLSLHRAGDPDLDALEYQFEIYTTPEFTRFVYQAAGSSPDWTVPILLDNNTRYYWRARSMDEHGVPGPWTQVSSFFIKTDYVNAEPAIEIIQPFEDVATNAQTLALRWTDDDPDSSALIALYYDTEPQGENGILITGDIQEDAEGDQDAYTWDISGLEDGAYYIYAVISDEDAQITHHAPVKITIDRTPPVITTTPPGGEYDSPVEVVITADEPSDIYYTLDGSTPGPGAALYTTPLAILESATLKSMAVDTVGNASQIRTHEYIFGLEQVTLDLVADTGMPITNTKIYVFKASGSYAGFYSKTDSEGLALFDPDKFTGESYRFRIDYLGSQFWSGPVTLPDTMYTKVTIPVETIDVAIVTANGPVQGYKVYLFSESGAYLGQYQRTDTQGRVSFELPEGQTYKFRADILGSQYWIEPPPIQGGGTNSFEYDAGGGTFSITLQKNTETPISGIRMYLFSPSGSYLGKYGITDESGKAEFEVTKGEYKIRTDYLGYQFWTEAVLITAHTAIDQTLPHKDITIGVAGVYQETATPVTEVKTYLFSPSGHYLNLYRKTDDQGQVVYSLPDRAYKIRADVLGQQFWSEAFTGLDTDINIPTALADVTVSGSGLPQADLKVYLFSGAGSYLGEYRKTDTEGRVSFMIPQGSYTFRADYEGSQYWSGIAALAPDISNPVDISVGGGSFEFIAEKDSGQPITGIKTYVFKENLSYIGLYGTTDNNGRVLFDLADGTFVFRFDYMGEQYWSDTVSVPDQLSHTLTLPHETVRVTLSTENTLVTDGKMYLFSEAGAYLGQYRYTDDAGLAEFTLPVGLEISLRADIFGHQIWSDPFTVQDTGTNVMDFNTGGGNLSATLQKDDLTPIAGIKTYLFTGNGSYTGSNRIGNDEGQLAFQLPEGNFKLRADYMGYRFWTDPISLTEDTAFDFILPHKDIDIIVEALYQGTYTPVTGIKTYLFTEADSYTNTQRTTDQDGKVEFSLPDQPYKIRADYMGRQFWSDAFRFMGAGLIIPHGIAAIEVTAMGAPVQGAKVYLFNENNQYLNTWSYTDTDGRASFQVPADSSYKFRTDVQGLSVWSDPIQVTADQTALTEQEVTE
ncbi:MAG: chitobiase/beta-hexosaminidase C-terminal domain-containing protein [Desulfobacterales bacterium]|nr:chitobiase/beta-hexosaminidase C-terminal domain-containing protein [Desulfobacterales bacterium]